MAAGATSSTQRSSTSSAVFSPPTSSAGFSPLQLPPPLPGECSTSRSMTESNQLEIRTLYESRGKGFWNRGRKLYSVSFIYNPRAQFVSDLFFTINVGFSQPELEVKEEELNGLEQYVAIPSKHVSFEMDFPDGPWGRRYVLQESMPMIARAMHRLATRLMSNPSLDSLLYWPFFNVDFITPLRGHPSLSALGIFQLELNPEALPVLRETICSLKALKTLQITGLSESESGVIVPGVLENLTGLSSLDLTSSHLSPEAVSAISHNLLHSTQLQILNLENARGDFVQPLVEALQSNSTLMGLEIAGVPLSVEQSKALGEMLQRNNALNSLSLTFANETRDGALFPIISALRVNRALGSLKIRETARFGQGAFPPLLPSLLVNTTLVALEMPGSTDDDHFNILGRVLAVNSTLRDLQLDLNRTHDVFKPECVRTFAAGLMNNSTLNSLHMGVLLDQNSEQWIAAALTQNFVLTSFSPYTDARNNQSQDPLRLHVLRNAENAPRRQASLFGLLMKHPAVATELDDLAEPATHEAAQG